MSHFLSRPHSFPFSLPLYKIKIPNRIRMLLINLFVNVIFYIYHNKQNFYYELTNFNLYPDFASHLSQNDKHPKKKPKQNTIVHLNLVQPESCYSPRKFIYSLTLYVVATISINKLVIPAKLFFQRIKQKQQFGSSSSNYTTNIYRCGRMNPVYRDVLFDQFQRHLRLGVLHQIFVFLFFCLAQSSFSSSTY